MRYGIVASMGLKENLKELMDARNENPHSLAGKTNVPQPTIHRILDGTSRDPRRATLEPLAKFFGMTVDELCGTKADGSSSVISTEQEQALEIMGSIGEKERDAWLTIGRALASAQLITDKYAKSSGLADNEVLESPTSESKEDILKNEQRRMSIPGFPKLGKVTSTRKKPNKDQQEK